MSLPSRLLRRALHRCGLTLSRDVIRAACEESQMPDGGYPVSVLYRLDRMRRP